MPNIRRFVLRLLAPFRKRRADTDLMREIQTHLQLLEEKFVLDGMSPREAHFAAKRAFGNVGLTKALQQDARSFRWLTGWAMELKLGVRMLVRYPGLTVVGSLAMAFAVVVGAGVFEVVQRATNPTLPLPEGDRIVGLAYWDRVENAGKRSSSYDFLTWREELTTLQEVGAFRLVERNLAAEDGIAEPTMVAQISPSAFRMTRVPPLLGRTLMEEDEDLKAPSVVVLGYRLWQTRFGGDPAVVGRTVRLGDVQTTVAGVMPAGFAFPVDDNVWTPLRSAELVRDPGHGALHVFGRLAPDADLDEAQAEAAIIGTRNTAAFPDHYANLTPQVLPYANSIIWFPPDVLLQAGIRSINAFAVLLLIVICANVALLMLTRSATREKEILVRTALGASRSRILSQLLLEALLLAALAAGLGLVVTNELLKATADALRAGDRWPFWLDGGLSPATVGYTAALTLLAAIIVGVAPGLKVMNGAMSDRLRQSTAGGGGLRIGKVWTGLIVTQIAATVLFTAVAYVVYRQATYIASVEPVYPAEKYLSVRLEMESEGAAEETDDAVLEPRRRDFAAAVRELERRLAGDGAVSGVTVAEQLPLMATTSHRAIEVSGASREDRPRVGASAVPPNFFEVFQMPVLAGRVFDSRDLVDNANTVVVNNLFADRFFNGLNAVGQQIRFKPVESADHLKPPARPGPWLEIVGVVRDLAPNSGAPLGLDNPAQPRLYQAFDVSQGNAPLYLAVHARTDPASLTPTLRRIAADVSPLLRLHDILPLDNAVSRDANAWHMFTNGFAGASAIVLLLSLAGMYSVTSFTVTRRTREIGVRVALGASAPRLISEIFRGPLIQVVAGVVAGCGLLALVTFTRSESGVAVARQAAILLAYGAGVIGVCALACVGPTLRALRVNPVEALREDV